MENYIEIKDLVIDYGESLAVDKVNIKVKKGHLVTLLGPSGCGKSTTLNALAGLITPTSGKIYFNGKDVTRTSPSNRGVGLVFQSYALYPHMSVYDNISFALKSSKEYRDEINEFNQEIEYKILEQKWIALGLEKELFDNALNSIKEYKNALKERDEFIVETENRYKSSVAEAKELIKSEKIKMDGKIKASSDNILSLIEKIEKEIKELNFKASILIKKESSKDKKSLIKSNLEKDVKKLLEDKEKAIKKYDANVERYKKDFSDNSEKLKKVQKDSITEANKVRNKNLNILKNTHNTNVNKLKKEYSAGLSLINKKTKSFNKKTNLEVNEIIDGLNSQKKDFIGEIDRRVKDVAEKVGITKNLNKMVTNLSGGQQQRVAISRTLIKNPDILLLDEPLSNLDAKMRISTREWIRELQQDLGITTIFVTHDQEEAMSISDEIVCMSVGHVQQKSAPMDMYHQPENKFVAGFLGMPMMNFFTKGEMHEKIAKKVKIPAKKATFGCRPEHIKLVSDFKSNEKALLKLNVEVSLSEAYGREVLVTSHTADGEIIRFFVDTEDLKRGDQIEIALKKSKVYAFENKNDEKVIGRF